MNNKVPVWEKYALTITEAAEYFHIGEQSSSRLKAISKYIASRSICNSRRIRFVFPWS